MLYIVPPFKLELDDTVVAKFHSNHVCCRFLCLFFELLYNFSSHLAINKYLGVDDKDITNCAVDKIVFKVIVTQK